MSKRKISELEQILKGDLLRIDNEITNTNTKLITLRAERDALIRAIEWEEKYRTSRKTKNDKT